jgi:hypothetical protein
MRFFIVAIGGDQDEHRETLLAYATSALHHKYHYLLFLRVVLSILFDSCLLYLDVL